MDNPLECGEDACDDPTYASEHPQECGGNPCDDPVYKAANPEKCITVDPCANPIFAMLNPDICADQPPTGEGTLGGGGTRTMSSEQMGVAELGLDYDIGGKSIFAPPEGASGGKIESYDIVNELENILRRR